MPKIIETVAELRAALAEMPDDMPVRVITDNGDYCDFTLIKEAYILFKNGYCELNSGLDLQPEDIDNIGSREPFLCIYAKPTDFGDLKADFEDGKKVEAAPSWL
jgi:hypothetical protein